MLYINDIKRVRMCNLKKTLTQLHRFVQLVFLSSASLMHANSLSFVVTIVKTKRWWGTAGAGSPRTTVVLACPALPYFLLYCYFFIVTNEMNP